MKDNKGFSLIELIVLMGILAIVIGAGGMGMYGSMQRSKAKNQASDFNSKISELYSASMSKAEDYRLVATLDGDTVKYSFQRNSRSGWTAYNSASSKIKGAITASNSSSSYELVNNSYIVIKYNSVDGAFEEITAYNPSGVANVEKIQKIKFDYYGKSAVVNLRFNTGKHSMKG